MPIYKLRIQILEYVLWKPLLIMSSHQRPQYQSNPLSPWCYMVSLGGGHMPRLVLKNVTKSGAPTHAMLGKGAGVVSRSISEHLNDILFF